MWADEREIVTAEDSLGSHPIPDLIPQKPAYIEPREAYQCAESQNYP